MMDTDQLLIGQFFKDHENLAINYIESLDVKDIASLTESLTLDQNCQLFSKLNAYRAGQVIEKIPVEKAGIIISRLSTLVAQSLLRVAKPTNREAILNQLKPELAIPLRRGLAYSQDRVGAHIDSLVLTLSGGMTIEKGLAAINSSTANAQPHFFILDKEKKLTGYVELFDLLQGEGHMQINTKQRLVNQPALADMSIGDLLDHWDHTLVYLPVVDINGVFIGSVSRAVLSEIHERRTVGKSKDYASIKAGNALGDLYMIGLTSLLGSPSDSDNKA